MVWVRLVGIILLAYSAGYFSAHVKFATPEPLPEIASEQITSEQAEILHQKMNHIIDEQLVQDREVESNENKLVELEVRLIELKKYASLLEGRLIRLEK